MSGWQDPGFLGADPDELERLAASMGAHADVLFRHRSTLNALLHEVPWIGELAEAFRHEWTTSHMRIMAAAAELLRGAQKALLHKAELQRRASAPDGASTMPSGIVLQGGFSLQGSNGAGLQGSNGAGLQGSDAALLAGAATVVVGEAAAVGTAGRAAPPAQPTVPPAPAPGNWGQDGGQTYSVQHSIAIARAEEGTPLPTLVNGSPWNARGQCMVSVQRWVNQAGGTFAGAGDNGPLYGLDHSPGVAKLGVVTPLTSSDLRPGDVLQRVDVANPGSWKDVHTVMVTANKDGVLSIIQSNVAKDPGDPTMTCVTEDPAWSLAHNLTTDPGTEWVAYRFAAQA